MKAILTPRQMTGWIRFYNQEPWGFAVDEERYLRIAALIGQIDRKTFTLVPPPEDDAPEVPALPAHVQGDSLIGAISKAFFRAEQTTPLKPGVHASGESSSP